MAHESDGNAVGGDGVCPGRKLDMIWSPVRPWVVVASPSVVTGTDIGKPTSFRFSWFASIGFGIEKIMENRAVKSQGPAEESSISSVHIKMRVPCAESLMSS